MKNEKYKIGAILREYRQKNHLTQEQLAEMIDITPGFLGQIERDETYPSIDNLTKLIRKLNIDANTIFHPQDNPLNKDTDIFFNEIKIQFPKLTREHQEITLTLIRKLSELQNRNEQKKPQ